MTEPLHVAAYIEPMQTGFVKPSVKQRLAAIRMLFDWLVTAQIVATNPAHSVRGPMHVVKTSPYMATGDLRSSGKIIRPHHPIHRLNSFRFR